MRRYDYDQLYNRPRAPMPEPYGWWWGPGAVMPDAPMYGWGWWGGGWGWPTDPALYGPAPMRPPRRPPRDSPAFGRYGDEYARAWARRYGYDLEMTIQPADDRPSSRYPGRQRYDW